MTERMTEAELAELLREAQSAHDAIYSEWSDDWPGLELTQRAVAEMRRLRGLIMKGAERCPHCGDHPDPYVEEEAAAIREEGGGDAA